MDFLDKIGGGALKTAELLGLIIGPYSNAFLGRKLGGLASYFTPRELAVVSTQLRFVAKLEPTLLKFDPKELLYQIYSHIGESVAELPHFKFLLERDESDNSGFYPRYKRIEVVGRDPCKDVIDNQEGALVLSGHIGNFELLAAYHIASGLKVTILGREPNYQFLSRWIQNIRTVYGSESLLRGSEGENKRGSALASIRALKTGKALAMLPGQDTSLASEFVPFFGLPAAHVVSLIALAARANRKIFTSFIVRIGKLRHKVFSEKLEYDQNSENPEKEILQEYSKRLERLVIEYPTQYLWIHRRWRREPGINYDEFPEKLRSSRQYLDWLDSDPRTGIK